MSKTNNRSLTIRLPEKTFAKVVEKAQKQDIKPSQVVRHAITAYLKVKK